MPTVQSHQPYKAVVGLVVPNPATNLGRSQREQPEAEESLWKLQTFGDFDHLVCELKSFPSGCSVCAAERFCSERGVAGLSSPQ